MKKTLFSAPLAVLLALLVGCSEKEGEGLSQKISFNGYDYECTDVYFTKHLGTIYLHIGNRDDDVVGDGPEGKAFYIDIRFHLGKTDISEVEGTYKITESPPEYIETVIRYVESKETKTLPESYWITGGTLKISKVSDGNYRVILNGISKEAIDDDPSYSTDVLLPVKAAYSGPIPNSWGYNE